MVVQTRIHIQCNNLISKPERGRHGFSTNQMNRTVISFVTFIVVVVVIYQDTVRDKVHDMYLIVYI